MPFNALNRILVSLKSRSAASIDAFSFALCFRLHSAALRNSIKQKLKIVLLLLVSCFPLLFFVVYFFAPFDVSQASFRPM